MIPRQVSTDEEHEERTLGRFDVLCGKSKEGRNHLGNKRYHVYIKSQLQRYMDAPSRFEKTGIVQAMVHALVTEMNTKFLKPTEDGTYQELNAKEIRDKVSHSIRDAVRATKKRSSKARDSMSASRVSSSCVSVSSSASVQGEFLKSLANKKAKDTSDDEVTPFVCVSNNDDDEVVPPPTTSLDHQITFSIFGTLVDGTKIDTSFEPEDVHFDLSEEVCAPPPPQLEKQQSGFSAIGIIDLTTESHSLDLIED